MLFFAEFGDPEYDPFKPPVNTALQSCVTRPRIMCEAFQNFSQKRSGKKRAWRTAFHNALEQGHDREISRSSEENFRQATPEGQLIVLRAAKRRVHVAIHISYNRVQSNSKHHEAPFRFLLCCM
jgi:hypothetical protein